MRMARRFTWEIFARSFGEPHGTARGRRRNLERRGAATCYLRDIERDYDAFNEERTPFFEKQKLDPLPASTAIQAILCRPELLVEIEAIAMFIPPGKDAGHARLLR